MCVHNQIQISSLTCFDRLALFESTSYLWKRWEERAGVSALEETDGNGSSAANATGIYRLSKSVMGPSSSSPTISPEAQSISLPGIPGSKASHIKVTLNALIGSDTYMRERHGRRNVVRVSNQVSVRVFISAREADSEWAIASLFRHVFEYYSPHFILFSTRRCVKNPIQAMICPNQVPPMLHYWGCTPKKRKQSDKPHNQPSFHSSGPLSPPLKGRRLPFARSYYFLGEKLAEFLG